MPYELGSKLKVTSVKMVNAPPPKGSPLQLQFHGTPAGNLGSILQHGFRMPTKCGALGVAIYFSRSAKTAFWHSRPQEGSSGGSGTPIEGKLLLCAVNVGNAYSLCRHDPSLSAKKLAAHG